MAHGPAAVTALASGSVDVATNAPEVFLALAGKGQSLKLIAGQTRQLGVLAARPGLDVPAGFPDSVEGAEGQEDRRHRALLGDPVSFDRDAQLGRARCDRRRVHRGRHRRAAGARRAPCRRRGADRPADRDLADARRARRSSTCAPRPTARARSTSAASRRSACGRWATGSRKNREAVARIRSAIAKADMFLHDPANADFAKQLLGSHISAELQRAGARRLHRRARSPCWRRTSRARDLERWIAIDFKGGVITQRMPVADVFADGTPESPQAVKDLAARSQHCCESRHATSASRFRTGRTCSPAST